MPDAPVIKVGIVTEKRISMTLNSEFSISPGGSILSGDLSAEVLDGRIVLKKNDIAIAASDLVKLDPLNSEDSSFTLHDVTIGISFHWERKEDQVFRGSLMLLPGDLNVTAVNVISVEEYLESVISSEMSASATEEFLKSHAVISRSWLLAQIDRKGKLLSRESRPLSEYSDDNEVVKWWDREDHIDYDVCADDHCQRYQGITRATGKLVSKVIEETKGEVLVYNGSICDARFYKCCGGVTELFENTWEPVNHPYLQKIFDNPVPPQGYDLHVDREQAAIDWISGNPEAFCNTTNKRILSQVLNDYDQETNDFYRWKVGFSQEELSALVHKRTGIDFGLISDLEPVERGASGRISRLRITGSKKTMIIGKELLIRKALSESHLYSSCFFVEKTTGKEGIQFTIRGAGWGHGVGLCQIGAAVMGDNGYTYKEILLHYFRGADLKKLY